MEARLLKKVGHLSLLQKIKVSTSGMKSCSRMLPRHPLWNNNWDFSSPVRWRRRRPRCRSRRSRRRRPRFEPRDRRRCLSSAAGRGPSSLAEPSWAGDPPGRRGSRWRRWTRFGGKDEPGKQPAMSVLFISKPMTVLKRQVLKWSVSKLHWYSGPLKEGLKNLGKGSLK